MSMKIKIICLEEENKIKFDYILREGMSKTQNAKHLMRLAGIEF